MILYSLITLWFFVLAVGCTTVWERTHRTGWLLLAMINFFNLYQWGHVLGQEMVG